MEKNNKKEIEMLKRLVEEAQYIVFVSGAGMSTESGIPDFRGEAGLYVKENNYKYTPRKMLSKSFFLMHPRYFYDFYRTMLPKFEIRPNAGHYALTKLQERKDIVIVTQNVDGLHERAGNKNVFNIHGTAITNHCMFCRRKYSHEEMQELLKSGGVPHCPRCKVGRVRPDVVLYDEIIPFGPLKETKKAIKNADLVIVAGTTLTVNPTRYLISKYKGKIAVINQGETTADEKASVVIHGKISDVLSQIA